MESLIEIASHHLYDNLPLAPMYHYASWFIQSLVVTTIQIFLAKRCFPSLFTAPRREEAAARFEARPPTVRVETNPNDEDTAPLQEDSYIPAVIRPVPASRAETLVTPPEHPKAYAPTTPLQLHPLPETLQLANHRTRLPIPIQSDSDKSAEDMRNATPNKYAKIAGRSSTEPGSSEAEIDSCNTRFPTTQPDSI